MNLTEQFGKAMLLDEWIHCLRHTENAFSDHTWLWQKSLVKKSESIWYVAVHDIDIVLDLLWTFNGSLYL
jgi:hypothetical protein